MFSHRNNWFSPANGVRSTHLLFEIHNNCVYTKYSDCYFKSQNFIFQRKFLIHFYAKNTCFFLGGGGGKEGSIKREIQKINGILHWNFEPSFKSILRIWKCLHNFCKYSSWLLSFWDKSMAKVILIQNKFFKMSSNIC